MFFKLENLLQRYARRIESGSDAALFSIEREWPRVAERCRIDVTTVHPIRCRGGVVTLACSSSEEASRLRLLRPAILQALKEKVPQYRVVDIKTITQ